MRKCFAENYYIASGGRGQGHKEGEGPVGGESTPEEHLELEPDQQSATRNGDLGMRKKAFMYYTA